MILAILQARVSSSRLPGKVLKPILGKPMILQEIERIKRSKMIDEVIVATSIESSDDELVAVCENNGQKIYRGSLNDVLDRYYKCAEQYNAEIVVRLTGDCPLLDWNVIDETIQQHLDEQNDYTSNGNPPTYPDGLDTEVMRFSALKVAWENAKLPSEREHVTPYIRNHPEIFKLGNKQNRNDLSDMRWTVDEPKDFSFVEKVYEELYFKNKSFSMQDVVELLKAKPSLAAINSGFIRNEGLLKSLEEDKKFLNKG